LQFLSTCTIQLPLTFANFMSNLKNTITESVVLNGRTYTFSTGRLAQLANGACEVRLGDTIVLATVVASRNDSSLDYFPLTVEYQEKLYAGGKIKGSRWVKREGRPSDEAILTARLIDRSIRPLFPDDYHKEVQLVVTVLSVDGENDPDIPAILAASAALSISDIPWDGPVAGVRVGLKEGNFFVNPTYTERGYSELDLVVSGRQGDILMVEAGALEVSEEEMSKAFIFGQENIDKMVKTIVDFTKKAGRPKQVFAAGNKDAKLIAELQNQAKPVIEEILKNGRKGDLDLTMLWALKNDLLEKYPDQPKNFILETVDDFWKEKSRIQTLKDKIRIDGRKLDEIRSLAIDVHVLPRTHGSAIFQRGNTQALTITTLGSPSEGQLLETMEGEETKRYIHHYYMPPYSVGETGRLGWPSRREVGHGALAERALEPMIPEEDKFPYTIRVVSEITTSNGSTSMASVCGSTLSLMDAGVPIKKPVAGIAMGLIVNSKCKNQNSKWKDEDYVILTDILGEEDHLGDMDFKVAGTKDGITALQMDIKVKGITQEILSKAIKEAKKARLSILEEMLKVMPKARPEVSKYAPRIALLHINPEKIGEVIGSGGRVIKNIINTTGCTIDVEDDGTVAITGTDPEALNKAISWVDGLTRELQPGEEFEGVVKRIQGFGVFVEVMPGKEGLVHISQVPGNISDPYKIFTVGQKIKVFVREVDAMGRLNLTMLSQKEAKMSAKRNLDIPERRFNRFEWGDRSDFNRRNFRRNDNRNNRDQRGFRQSRDNSYNDNDGLYPGFKQKETYRKRDRR
jgi:polyribonucleotide nucleotidyltransferase